MVNPVVFFDIDIGDKHAGRILMELFADTTPKVAEIFRAFCTGEKMGKNGKPLHYKGLNLTYVYKDKWLILKSHEKTYDEIPLEKENHVKKYTGPGDLAMAFNNSEFHITLSKPSGGEKNVVFGKVFGGMDVLIAIDSVGSGFSGSEKPTKSVIIVDCGQVHDDVAEEEEEPY